MKPFTQSGISIHPDFSLIIIREPTSPKNDAAYAKLRIATRHHEFDCNVLEVRSLNIEFWERLNITMHYALRECTINWANALCPMPYALCPMPYALCPMPFALCPLPFALCPLPFALCPLPFALCPLPFALCPLPFAPCTCGIQFAYCTSGVNLMFTLRLFIKRTYFRVQRGI
jgi:hypothetical protein